MDCSWKPPKWLINVVCSHFRKELTGRERMVVETISWTIFCQNRVPGFAVKHNGDFTSRPTGAL